MHGDAVSSTLSHKLACPTKIPAVHIYATASHPCILQYVLETPAVLMSAEPNIKEQRRRGDGNHPPGELEGT